MNSQLAYLTIAGHHQWQSRARSLLTCRLISVSVFRKVITGQEVSTVADTDDRPSSWQKFDTLMRQSQAVSPAVPIGSKEALESIPERAAEIRQSRLDIIGKIKANGIERRAGLEAIKAMYEAQIETGKHALKRAVEVEKQRVDLVAEKYIYQITQEYLRDMNDLGIHNYNARVETLFRLNEETTRLLEQAEKQNVPQSLKDQTVDGIIKKHTEFYKRLIADEIALSDGQRNHR